MQEFFYTILAIWVISRLFSAFSGGRTSSGSSQTYQQTNNHFYSQKKTEGEIKIETKKTPETKIPPDEGEYVDYEEVK
jgi:hypothetical protein